MDFPFESLSDALLVIIALLLIVRGKRMVNYVVDATAKALVKSINGQLGLDGIRDDIAHMKRQVSEVPDLRLQIQNLEGQIEAKLTDE